MSDTAKFTKEQIREWMRERQAKRQPLPDLSLLRQQFGFKHAKEDWMRFDSSN